MVDINEIINNQIPFKESMGVYFLLKNNKIVYIGQATTELKYVTWFDEFGELRSLTPVTMMQYTGLKDKNGKEIYEGDLFIWNMVLRVVEYREDKASFMGKRVSGYKNSDFYFYLWNLQNLLDKVEVIGNIYENSELLK